MTWSKCKLFRECCKNNPKMALKQSFSGRKRGHHFQITRTWKFIDQLFLSFQFTCPPMNCAQKNAELQLKTPLMTQETPFIIQSKPSKSDMFIHRFYLCAVCTQAILENGTSSVILAMEAIKKRTANLRSWSALSFRKSWFIRSKYSLG